MPHLAGTATRIRRRSRQENFWPRAHGAVLAAASATTRKPTSIPAAARGLSTGWNLKRPAKPRRDPTAAFSFVYNANQATITTRPKPSVSRIYSGRESHGGFARAAAAGMQDGLGSDCGLVDTPRKRRAVLATKLYGLLSSSETVAPENPAFINDPGQPCTCRIRGRAIKPVICKRLLHIAAVSRSPSIFFHRAYSWAGRSFVARWPRSQRDRAGPGFSRRQRAFPPPDQHGTGAAGGRRTSAGWALRPGAGSRPGAMLAAP